VDANLAPLPARRRLLDWLPEGPNIGGDPGRKGGTLGGHCSLTSDQNFCGGVRRAASAPQGPDVGCLLGTQPA